ncbi:hypothetical protein PgNI_06711 [Pyricularia grisea]|uniref:Uncharacterized protein n=1 Tax=Pyricularia grisea TaxID=148305 RepID=A0A6P8B7G4_PYRGI|nr:hypothetical protein PgNI_06711 [Pyricularia grisea]TLD11262.1 hypothetical protein PgNI_06711 [Pyricularia grisea]
MGFKNVIKTVKEGFGWKYREQRQPFLDAKQFVFKHLGSQIQRFCSRTKIVRAELVLKWVTIGESSVLYVLTFITCIGVLFCTPPQSTLHRRRRLFAFFGLRTNISMAMAMVMGCGSFNATRGKAPAARLFSF